MVQVETAALKGGNYLVTTVEGRSIAGWRDSSHDTA
jgi:hypothetical protein